MSVIKVDHTLVPHGYQGDVRSIRVWLTSVIDALGEQSAAAQGLDKAITTADKLRNAPHQTLYLLKDQQPRDGGGGGEVVGLLKVGPKKLFIWDEAGRMREVQPLCVLDFFVVRQRHGLGLRLFQHMLEDQGARVEQLAVDGPSPKMEAFLRRHYAVPRLLRQANNFAVAPDFFTTELHSPGQGGASVVEPVGRYAAHQPASAIAALIHGSDASPPPRFQLGANIVSSVSRTASPPTPPASPPAATPRAAVGAAGGDTPRRDSQLTKRGYFDVKFYHNKLW